MDFNGAKYPVYVNELLTQYYHCRLFVLLLKSTSVSVKEWKKTQLS